MEVFSTEIISTYTINIIAQICTCFEWKHSGIPCSLALAVSLANGHNPQDYAKAFYQLDAHRAIYANSIFPPNADTSPANTPTISIYKSDDSDSDNLLPPNSRHQPGRPKKRRIHGSTEEGDREPKCAFHCGRCGTIGHSKKTCTGVAI